MSKKKRNLKLNSNLIIAIGVLIASFGALYISKQQATIMNEQTKILLEQSKASAWPSLAINVNKSFTDRVINFQFTVSNRGTGPAIIEQCLITYDGKSVSNWGEFYEIINVPDSIKIGHSNSMLYKRIISPNEDFNLIDWSNNKRLMNYVFSKADKINIEICYKSVYGDFWKAKRIGMKGNLEKNQNEKIDICSSSNMVVFEE